MSIISIKKVSEIYSYPQFEDDCIGRYKPDRDRIYVSCPLLLYWRTKIEAQTQTTQHTPLSNLRRYQARRRPRRAQRHASRGDRVFERASDGSLLQRA